MDAFGDADLFTTGAAEDGEDIVAAALQPEANSGGEEEDELAVDEVSDDGDDEAVEVVQVVKKAQQTPKPVRQRKTAAKSPTTTTTTPKSNRAALLAKPEMTRAPTKRRGADELAAVAPRKRTRFDIDKAAMDRHEEELRLAHAYVQAQKAAAKAEADMKITKYMAAREAKDKARGGGGGGGGYTPQRPTSSRQVTEAVSRNYNNERQPPQLKYHSQEELETLTTAVLTARSERLKPTAAQLIGSGVDLDGPNENNFEQRKYLWVGPRGDMHFNMCPKCVEFAYNDRGKVLDLGNGYEMITAVLCPGCVEGNNALGRERKHHFPTSYELYMAQKDNNTY